MNHGKCLPGLDPSERRWTADQPPTAVCNAKQSTADRTSRGDTVCTREGATGAHAVAPADWSERTEQALFFVEVIAGGASGAPCKKFGGKGF